ncbi:amidase [Methylobacterium nigriterrae]|uniref:amidase n=1 Tax=Methylobacterium nigriterrae TaxID=3127512 RepID=UPI0030138D77
MFTSMDPSSLTRRALVVGGVAAASIAALQSSSAAAKSQVLPVSISEAGEQFRAGTSTSVEITSAYLDGILKLQPQLNAFISVLNDEALRTASERDAELRSGRDRGPLHGIPVVIKDLFEMRGTRTTVGSKAFENRVTEKDATVVARLRDAGAVILGKTNMNELAAGVSGTNTAFGDTHNPWDLERSPGGSSSGTGAAIAAGLCLGGLGTDTGGSIRVPAAWCGITGIRPTFGLVSTYGAFPRSYSLDTVGPLARNVRDLALILDVIAGFDPNDKNSTLLRPHQSYTRGLGEGVKGMRFGLVKDYTFSDVDPDIANAVRGAAETLAGLGANIEEIRIEPLEGQLDYSKLFNEILLYEFNQILGERYRSMPNRTEMFGRIVQDNIDAGSKVSREAYDARIAERPFLTAEVKSAFQRVDALLTPALPSAAPLLKASAQDYSRGRQFTFPFSYTALPSVVVPCAFSPEGLPIGLQFVGDHFQEAQLLRIAAAFEEKEIQLQSRRPKVFLG